MLKELRAQAGVSSFLSRHNSNPKVAKAEQLLGVRTAVLHLAPGNMSGFEVCQSRSPGCTAACLHFAGNPLAQGGKDRSRINKTLFFFQHRRRFMDALRRELANHARTAERRQLHPAVRLNGTSDLPWERIRGDFGTLLEAFPEITFYDYTAVVERLRRPLPPNYHLTFSVKENNLAESLEAAHRGFNLAAVFDDALPSYFLGMPVIDGDEHDYRPADPKGVVVGLSAKGRRAKEDTTGFVLGGEPSALAA